MSLVTPGSAAALADYLRCAGERSESITVRGHNTKQRMAGPQLASDHVICTAGLNRLLRYEPNDLTISVEAGMPWSALQGILVPHRQMVALDPPFFQQATVGGVIASNSSGPSRRAYGAARDLVIGMEFATLAGECVPAGGMVVKNVAGLDMGKLLIGSFGTLAVLTRVNFRLHAIPEQTRTFLFPFVEVDAAIAKRDAILQSTLRPLSLDLLSPLAAIRFHRKGFLLAIRAGGSASVLARYGRDLPGAEPLNDEDDERFWAQMREFTPDFLQRQPAGIVLRVSFPLADVRPLLRLCSDACIIRAGNGIAYVHLSGWPAAAVFLERTARHGWTTVVEFAPPEVRAEKPLWFSPEQAGDAGFAMMKKIKQMFDPGSLLNCGRMYGRL